MNNNHDLGNSAQAPTPSGEAAAYASLSQLVYADRPLADTLDKLISLAKEVLSETPEVSLTVIEDKGASTPASTGPLALQLDQHQYDAETGPCLDAALYGETIALTMAGPDQPYAQFRDAAQHQGVTHTLSVGLSTGDHALGALNIYSSTGQAFSEDSDRIARTFASCVAIILANLDRYRRAATLAAQLEVALQSRASIDQAKGIIMASLGCSSDEAFKVLVRRSQDQNIKLRLLAEELVERAARARGDRNNPLKVCQADATDRR
jgi:GAF domain-containing protein